jgi:hypothetical protein
MRAPLKFGVSFLQGGRHYDANFQPTLKTPHLIKIHGAQIMPLLIFSSSIFVVMVHLSKTVIVNGQFRHNSAV